MPDLRYDTINKNAGRARNSDNSDLSRYGFSFFSQEIKKAKQQPIKDANPQSAVLMAWLYILAVIEVTFGL
jgi:hypothetical protein